MSGHNRTSRRLVFTNRKGGCGKTTTTVNIAAALAHMGHTVLVIDTDPQAHATMSLGVGQAQLRGDLGDVASGRVGALEALRATYIPRLKLIPASRRLAEYEHRNELNDEARYWFRRRLGALMDRFDYTIFDTPPTVQLLTVSALVAAREAYIPTQAHFLAVEGMVEIIELVTTIRERYNPELVIRGIVPTFFEEQATFSKEILEDVRGGLGESVVMVPIHHNAALAEAPGHGRTIFQHDLRSTGAVDYYRAALQIKRLGPPGPD